MLISPLNHKLDNSKFRNLSWLNNSDRQQKVVITDSCDLKPMQIKMTSKIMCCVILKIPLHRLFSEGCEELKNTTVISNYNSNLFVVCTTYWQIF